VVIAEYRKLLKQFADNTAGLSREEIAAKVARAIQETEEDDAFRENDVKTILQRSELMDKERVSRQPFIERFSAENKRAQDELMAAIAANRNEFELEEGEYEEEDVDEEGGDDKVESKEEVAIQ